MRGEEGEGRMNFGKEEMEVMGEAFPWVAVRKWGCAVPVR